MREGSEALGRSNCQNGNVKCLLASCLLLLATNWPLFKSFLHLWWAITSPKSLKLGSNNLFWHPK